MIVRSEYPFPVKKMFLEGGPTLTYIDVGKGPQTLIFVHGLANFLPIWARNIQILKKYYRCIALDLPGHGLSSSDDYPYTISFYQEILKAWLDELAIPPAVLIGHSMGGQISVRMLVDYPEHFSHLILVAPAGFETFSASEVFLLNQWINFGESEYLKGMFEPRNYFHKMREREYVLLKEFFESFYAVSERPKLLRTLSRSMKGMLDEPIFEDLPQISVPTLVLFGKEDQLIPNRALHRGRAEQVARAGTEAIAGSQLRLYPLCGHFLQFEMPSRFNIDVYKFLNPKIFGA